MHISHSPELTPAATTMAELARFQVVDVGHITDVAPVSKLFHDVLAQERAIQVCGKIDHAPMIALSPVYGVSGTSSWTIHTARVVRPYLMGRANALGVVRRGTHACTHVCTSDPVGNAMCTHIFIKVSQHRWSWRAGFDTARRWRLSCCP